MLNKNVKPAYEVKALPNTFVTERKSFEREMKDKKPTGRLVPTTKKVAGGFMIFFPQGHSLRVCESELKRLGLNESPDSVDMENGIVYRAGQERARDASLEEMVSRRTKQTRGGAQVSSEQIDLGE